MQRLTREDIRMRIAVALAVLRPSAKRALGVDVERVREEVAADLTHRIMGRDDSEAVILVPSRVPDVMHDRPGRWGADEPHPDTYLPLRE